jgi:hypothetical protein
MAIADWGDSHGSPAHRGQVSSDIASLSGALAKSAEPVAGRINSVTPHVGTCRGSETFQLHDSPSPRLTIVSRTTITNRAWWAHR